MTSGFRAGQCLNRGVVRLIACATMVWLVAGWARPGAAKRALMALLAGLLTLWLLACSTTSSDTSSDSGSSSSSVTTTAIVDGATVTIAALTLSADDTTLDPGDDDSVTLTALVRDASNKAVSGVAVDFRTVTNSDGTLEITQGTTDGSGTAIALLKSNPNKTERTISVQATVGNLSSNVVAVTVSATTISAGGSAVASVTLLTSSPQLNSNGEDSVTLTALVRDNFNNALEGVAVTFGTVENSDATIEVTRGTTDASGTAAARLKAKPNKQNRTVKVRATADGKLSGILSITVTGTTLTISGSASVISGDSPVLDIQLRDSADNGIAGETLAVTSTAGQSLSTAAPVTDASGRATVTVANITQDDTFTVTAFSGTLSQSFAMKVSQNFKLAFSAPTAAQEILINTPETVTVNWTSAGVPQVGRTVNFAATRGTLSAASAVTDANGDATVPLVTLTSPTSVGPSVITASGTEGTETLSAQRTVEFVSDTPAALTLQVAPSAVGVNVGGDSSQQAEITAIVRDANNQMVKNQTVNFVLTTDTTGGGISQSAGVTDSFGRTRITYTAGAVSSATDGVTISATLASNAAISDNVTLTVADEALFITLGTGNTVLETDDDTYTKFDLPYTALVTDANGGPVAGVVLTVNIQAQEYYKGCFKMTPDADGNFERWKRMENDKFQNEDTDQDGILDYEDKNGNGLLDSGEDKNGNGLLDPGEDKNGNGLLDPGEEEDIVHINSETKLDDFQVGKLDTEDTNKNGQLDPGIVAAVVPSIVVTDSNGFADFNVSYPQNYGSWVKVKLTASGAVSGTESRKSVTLLLPTSNADIFSEFSPPPNSPFGQEAPPGGTDKCDEEDL